MGAKRRIKIKELFGTNAITVHKKSGGLLAYTALEI